MITSSSLKKNGVSFFETCFFDLHGIMRSRIFPVNRFDTILNEGFGFDGSSVGFVDIEDSDTVAKPIEKSCRIVSFDGFKTALFLCEIIKDEKPFKWSGREILRDTVGRIKEKHNYDFKIGPETEFYLTRNGQPLDEAGYMFSNPMDHTSLFKKKFMYELQTSHPGFDVHVAHHEVGPSQHEFELKFDEPVAMMDKLVTFKYLLKNFAKKQSLEVTFMPKPFFGLAGSGMHFHVSVWEDNIPLFYENGSEVSGFAKQFIAGILKHSQEIALVTNSTVNSFKRLVFGHEAPVFVVWGYGNRSAMIRIPKYRAIKPERARVEIRTPDGMNNHYLALAAIIRAGMIGIEKSMEVSDPFKKSTYELKKDDCEKIGIEVLPRNLKEAIEHARKGKIIRELLDKRFNSFIRQKEKEWDEYCKCLESAGIQIETEEVTEWERKKYFGM